jgi:serine/threonine protein kinase/tetratricopeptide (TPR) repeat protein
MTGGGWERLKDALDAVLAAPPADRPRILAETCGHDPALMREVAELAASSDHLGGFLGGQDAASSPLSEDQILLGRFRLRRRLGSGGMGEVWAADDLSLDSQPVALKMLRLDAAWDPLFRERFVQEVLLAREVTHPNVCPIYEMFEDEAGGAPVRFLTMKLLEGETLRERISRSGPLPPGTALPLLRQIAAGLDAAHARGIVHADVKPSNVFLTPSGDAVLTDFGLARTVRGGANSSGHGAPWGTPGYMAPELAHALPDARSDVYAFGVLAHEVLTGALPGEAPPPAGRALSSLVRGCLAPAPERYPSAGAAFAAYDRARSRSRLGRRAALAAATLALATLAFVFAPVIRRQARLAVSDLPPARRVAVLPFSAASPEYAALAQGLAESLADDLARYEPTERNLWVVPPGDVRAEPAPARLAATFGVNLVLEGRVRADGPRTAVDLTLTGPNGTSPPARRTIVTPAEAQFRLSEYALAAAADMLILDPRTAIASGRAGATHPRAYAYFEEGVVALRPRTREAALSAIDLFQRAIEFDSRYAAAYARLAEAYGTLHNVTRSPEALEFASRNSLRALQLAPNLPAALVMASVIERTKGNLDRAVEHLNAALRHDPSHVEALSTLAAVHAETGRFEEAERIQLRIQNLRPNHWSSYNALGTLYYSRNRYEKAEEMFRKAIQAAPGNPIPQNNLAGVLLTSRRYSEARGVLQRSLAIRPSAAAFQNLATAEFELGNLPAAADAYRKAVDLAPGNHTAWRNLGDALQAAGQTREAAGAFRTAASLAAEALKVRPGDAALLSSLALYRAKSRDRDAAQTALQGFHATPNPDSPSLFRAAIAHELLGERRRAVELLRALARAGFSGDRIHSAPELKSLLAAQTIPELNTRKGNQQ